MFKIEKISYDHNFDEFDCGQPELNKFLKQYALMSQAAHSTQTYVAIDQQNEVLGYYSLCVGAAYHQDSPKRVSSGLPYHPIPLMILARLAVHKSFQGKGFGKGLLKDALIRTAQAADIAGIRAIIVHAKDENARKWYIKYNFEPSPTDPLHLFLLMKDIKKLIS